MVDRREGAGLETSFANGGQISACHAEPWAQPRARRSKILQAGCGATIRRCSSACAWTPPSGAGGCASCCECTPWRTREQHRADRRASALYSRAALRELRAADRHRVRRARRAASCTTTPTAPSFDAARAAAAADARATASTATVKTRRRGGGDRARARAVPRERIVGATYTAADESGDAHEFTREPRRAWRRARGVRFLYGHDDPGRCASGAGERRGRGREGRARARSETLTRRRLRGGAGQLLAAAHAARSGVDLPVYPGQGLLGHAWTIADAARAPTVSLTDEAAKLVITRLGNRCASPAPPSSSGYSTELNPVRCEAIARRAREIFPGAARLRPRGVLGGAASRHAFQRAAGGSARKLPNLYLNTGHGTLGWTLACGSGRGAGRYHLGSHSPDVDFRVHGAA